MTRLEQIQFIDHELKGLWPGWKPTEAEVRIWLTDLAAFDYAIARTAAQGCFREQAANYQRPVLRKFLDKARSLSQRTHRCPSSESHDPPATIFIECSDPPAAKPHLAGVRKPVYVRPASRRSDPDYVLACAEHMRTQFEHLYGGRWIAVRPTPSANGGH